MLDKSSINQPRVVRAQFKGFDFSAVRTILSAVGTGAVVISVTGLVSPSRGAPQALGDVKPADLLTNVVGGLVAGIGTFICGSTATTIVSQVGSGFPDAIYTIPGSLLGSIAYAQSHEAVRANLAGRFTALRTATIPQLFGLPYEAVALPMTAAIAVGLYLFEKVVPWVAPVKDEDDLDFSEGTVFSVSMSDRTWPPRLTGVGMGLLQLPAAALGSPLVTSSIFTTILAVAAENAPAKFGSLASGFTSADRLMQVNAAVQQGHTYAGTQARLLQILFHAGIAAGTFHSSKASSSWDKHRQRIVPGATKAWQFLGGFLVVYGSRVAGSGLSRHGHADLSHLSTGTIAALTATIVGGLAASFVSGLIWEDQTFSPPPA